MHPGKIVCPVASIIFFESKCAWSPFNGYKFKGTPTHTIIAGKIKMQQGKILGDPDGTPLKFS